MPIIVRASKKEVTEVTITVPANVAVNIAEAIYQTGDGGVDPFETIERGELNELARQVQQAVGFRLACSK